MATAHANISVIDNTLTRDDIQRFYSKDHADVWELIQLMGQAAAMCPPILDVISLVAEAADEILQSRGIREIERGWLELDPQQADRLAMQLPEDPDRLCALAEGEIRIEGAEAVEDRAKPGEALDPARLIQIMKDEKIGRPSTYARHIENVFEAVETEMLQIDKKSCFHITDKAAKLIECLDEPDLPTLDMAYSAQLEADLGEIEAGHLTPAQVLRQHLGRLPGIKTAVPDDSPVALREKSTIAPILGPGYGEPPRFSLPPGIDPSIVLPPNHPLQMLRAAFDKTCLQQHGRAETSRLEGSRRRAARAAALGKLLGGLPADALIERLRLDLGLRWVVRLEPTDRVWTANILNGLITDQNEVIDALCASTPKNAANTIREFNGLGAHANQAIRSPHVPPL